LQDCASIAATPSSAFTKALHAVYLSTVFLMHAIEHTKGNHFEELYLILDENEGVPGVFSKGNSLVCQDWKYKKYCGSNMTCYGWL